MLGLEYSPVIRFCQYIAGDNAMLLRFPLPDREVISFVSSRVHPDGHSSFAFSIL
jgi:hypothetical protein